MASVGCRPGSPWPSTCSSAGRTGRRWPRSAGTPGARCRGRCWCSIAIATVLFLLFAYATVTGFGYDVSSVGRSSIPFLTVADQALGPVRRRGLGGRHRLGPGHAGVGHQLAVPDDLRRRADRQAARGGSGVVRPSTRHAGPRPGGLRGRRPGRHRGVGAGPRARRWAPARWTRSGLYAECSTLGTIVILFVYLLTMVALPVYAWRRHRATGSPWCATSSCRCVGAAALVVPFVSLCTPGPARPLRRLPVRRPGRGGRLLRVGWGRRAPAAPGSRLTRRHTGGRVRTVGHRARQPARPHRRPARAAAVRPDRHGRPPAPAPELPEGAPRGRCPVVRPPGACCVVRQTAAGTTFWTIRALEAT